MSWRSWSATTLAVAVAVAVAAATMAAALSAEELWYWPSAEPAEPPVMPCPYVEPTPLLSTNKHNEHQFIWKQRNTTYKETFITYL